MVDAEGRVRILLTTIPQETPLLSLHDAQGITRLVMSVRRDGTPFLVLWDAQGRALFEVP